MSTSAEKLFGMMAFRIRKDVQDARMLIGQEATLVAADDKYHGRRGVVMGIMPDHKDGLLALLSILREDGSDYLKDDGPSRRYRPLYELELTQRRVFSPPEDLTPPKEGD